MALRRTLTKRLFNSNRNRDSPPLDTLQHSPIPPPSPSVQKQSTIPPNAAKTNFHRELLTLPESADSGFFRLFLQRRGINQYARLPDFLSVPVGDMLRDKLRSMNISGDRIHLDGLVPPVPEKSPSGNLDGLSVLDARKILRSSQLERVRSALRQIPVNSVSYSEFVKVCCDVCSNREQGVKFAEMLDECGNVIVIGNVVFLRPEQVARSMEKLISESIAIPNDPRKSELEEMEKQKAVIDQKAESLVRKELYCGLGFLVVQTLGFMRLTFWELTWDVMEPICFFVTSLHFALAYAFFLRTSKEPSFQGYFQRRFRAKQRKLMEVHNFDVEKYDRLCRAFYPNYYYNLGTPEHLPATEHA
ncbi:hypothetical protein RJ639_029599 [Escallonia herrerae]|uniref:Calcium uniporter protein C-terminal domain-containing protein n=1 Tax=Escallonia herrerae TaxID=1293975 RepID=A0AA89BDR3_9ASTE|nr:hypothetical protein RJ639_029599 [Escallonia herrerae]